VEARLDGRDITRIACGFSDLRVAFFDDHVEMFIEGFSMPRSDYTKKYFPQYVRRVA
jgi:hypothetical protein